MEKLGKKAFTNFRLLKEKKKKNFNQASFFFETQKTFFNLQKKTKCQLFLILFFL